ncbi:McrC family protein [Frankia sp. AgKG'84/4]|uniref:McrC family protein n=1 Tax=Frankia sp. AgKG'84/4 TaxID=573490 RepID=UPI00200E61A9|nr:McrC family protein [Frankia sp. AgKG'84/4]MCL9793682.1 McrC family protein [Frankia sp. AgKG'84/4]
MNVRTAPRRVVLAEYETRAVPGLPEDVTRTLVATGAVSASRDLDGTLRLTASTKVGLVRAGDLELVVRPKLGVARLLWMVGHTRDPAGWRDDDVNVDPADDLVAALAVAFTNQAARALAGGPQRGYQPVDESSSVLRGRLREADQMRARLGAAVPLEVRYDDYTTDIPENRILAGATRRLLCAPSAPAPTRAALHRLQRQLADVTPLLAGIPPPPTPATRLTRRYQPALRLARLILANRGIDMPPAASPGTVAATGFLFDMYAVYERWLTASLRRELERHGGAVDGQRVVHLDEAEKVAARPDITWWQGTRCLAVIDAKYKAHASVPTEDLYQLVTYCAALGLPDGHLVYAGGSPITHTILRAGVRIHAHVVDLSQPVPVLLDQIGRLGAAVLAPARR